MYRQERRSRHHYQGRARWYDWANRLAATLLGVSQTKERLKAIDRLALKSGQRVLEVSVGTGTNLPLMVGPVGPEGRLVGLDISHEMLSRCRRKLRPTGVNTDLVEGEAAHLPFPDGAFDAVFHHGGIAEFGDKRGAIEEMMRVARPGARIVVCDAGVPSEGRPPFLSRLLLRLQPIYAQPPPLDLIPLRAEDIRITWIRRGAWYLIDFVNV